MPDLKPGDIIGGHFEILERLGAGGMGEVFKARDLRLDRVVAIKTIKDHGERFEREARAVAALNHPHICGIYDIGPGYLVLEYVEGTSPRGPLPINEVWRLGAQVAGALAAAHAVGITHRDLKPENILVTKDGRAKVLDFGLAKWSEAKPLADNETTRTKSLTGEGTVIGTATYMSPEQAEGKPVDPRSDIFSLGAVLYELISGRRAFHGDSRMSILAAVLREEPKPLNADVPAEGARLISRMMRKDPQRRVQSMADVKLTLEDLREESTTGSSPPVVAPIKRRWWIPAAALALIACGAGWAWRSRITAGPGPEKVIQVTSYPGVERDPALSADGRQIAFSWDGDRDGGSFDIYVKLVETGTPIRLTTHEADDVEPSWSPDGNSIAFRRRGPDGGIFVVPSLGGPERRLIAIGNPSNVGLAFRAYGVGPAWSADGQTLFFVDDSIEPFALRWTMLDGSKSGELPGVKGKVGGIDSVAASPDGTRLAFRSAEGNSIGNMMLGELASGPSWKSPPQALPMNWAGRVTWLPASDTLLGARTLDPGLSWGSLNAKETHLIALAGIGIQPSAARAAPRVAFTAAMVDTNIWRVDLNHQKAPAVRSIASSRGEVQADATAPGGRVVFSSDRGGQREIWISDADGGNATALTSGSISPASARLSPDGKWVVFTHRPTGVPDIYLMDARGGPVRQLTTHPEEDHSARFSRDSQWIYFCSSRSGRREVWKMPLSGQPQQQVTRNGGWVSRESVDGKWLYYTRDGSSAIFRMPVAGGTGEMVIAKSSYAQWDVGAKGIYYFDDKTLYFRAFGAQNSIPLATMPKLAGPATGIALDAEERWLYFTQFDSRTSDIMVLDNFHPGR